MDGTASLPLAERTRIQISQAFQNRAANLANAQGELFEQLLSLSFTVQPLPAREPEPDVADSSSVADSTSETDNNDIARTDDEQEAATSSPVSLITQAIPWIAEKPQEPAADQPFNDTPAQTEVLKAEEVDTTAGTEPIAAAAIEAEASALANVTTVAPGDVTGGLNPDSTVAATSVADLNPDDTMADVGRPDNDADPRQAVPTTKLDSAPSEPSPGLAASEGRDPNESAAAQLPSDTQHRLEATSPAEDETQGRRGERQGKWFERKDEPWGAGAAERSMEQSALSAPREELDSAAVAPAESAAQPSTRDAATSVVEPLLATATPFPVTQPAALSAVVQGVIATASPTPTTTSASNSDPTNAVNPGPSRPVGSQATKINPNAKASEPGLSQQERVRVIQRIARSFNRLSTAGGTINLRLHPQHLGSVSMQVRLEGRTLSARLSTETAAARDAIVQDLPALRQRLADQGFDVTKFQVDIAGNGADASFAQSHGQPQSGQSENRSSGSQTDYRRFATNRAARTPETRPLLPTANPSWQTSSGIDLQA